MSRPASMKGRGRRSTTLPCSSAVPGTSRANTAKYICREEVEAGLTPGSDYPVFRTDFGTVGLMICYDVFFADPARALATKGAEMILMLIWGGDQTLGKARAIENKVFLIASGYDYPTYVMDPDGEILSLAQQQGAAAVATI